MASTDPILRFFPAPQAPSIAPHGIFLLGVASTGNIGQMCIDCVLSTASHNGKLTYLGSLESPMVSPMTGYEQFTPSSKKFLCMPLEVYALESASTPLYAIIQRAPCKSFKNKEFANALVDILQSTWHAQTVLVCTGASLDNIEVLQSERKFAYFSSDADVSIVGSSFPILAQFLDSLPHLTLHDSSQNTAGHITQQPSNQHFIVEDEEYYSEGGWFQGPPYGMFIAKSIVEQSKTIRNNNSNNNHSDVHVDDVHLQVPMNVCILGKYVNEGENMYDGMELAAMLVHSLGISPPDNNNIAVKTPMSWKQVSQYNKSDLTMFM